MNPQTLADKIRIILVNSSQPGNIGGALRAMKNMGLQRLYLVQPKVFPSHRALWRAAGAADLLGQIEICDSFQEAIADCHLVVGTSARQRRIGWPTENPSDAAERLVDEAACQREVALVFGREHSGLTNDELQCCHWHVQIPANPEYTSLNLCAAVQVLTYELRLKIMQKLEAVPEADGSWDTELANQSEMDYFYQHLEKVMRDTGFYHQNSPKQTISRMRRLFHRIRPDTLEVQILRGFLTSIETSIATDESQ